MLIDDAVLDGRVRELAVEDSHVPTPAVTLDGSTLTVSADGNFAAAHLHPGPHSLEVSAFRHDTQSMTIDLAEGRNSVTTSLPLTPEETYARYFNALKFRRSEVSYRYLFPDAKKDIPYSEWQKWGPGPGMTTFRVHASRVLPKWQSPITKKTYSDVVELDTTIVFGTGAGATEISYTQHLLQGRDGIWYILYEPLAAAAPGFD